MEQAVICQKYGCVYPTGTCADNGVCEQWRDDRLAGEHLIEAVAGPELGIEDYLQKFDMKQYPPTEGED